MTHAYHAALYMRLSKDDEGAAESSSITAQREMLKRYAMEQGFTVCGEYADDGYSGTHFNRPAFRRMILDIESGKIDLVLVKDLSRLGRDHIMTGKYTELYFPEKQVRFIAVNDGYDSESPFTDIAPFKNVINEMYARDTSRKIRSAFAAHMRAGAYVAAFAPYGYRKDPADRHHLVPDPEAALVVREIFMRAAEGESPRQIADLLNRRRIPSPACHRRSSRGEPLEECAEWLPSGIAKMLKNIVYLGHTAQGKSTKASFKSRYSIRKPYEEWIIVPNTHEPLIDGALFELVKRWSSVRKNPKSSGFCNRFAGLVYCADCKKAMSSAGTRKRSSPANLVCGKYKLHGSSACTNHFIDYNALHEIVCHALREEFSPLVSLTDTLLCEAERRLTSERSAFTWETERGSLAKRARQLTDIMGRLYEDQAAGLLGQAQMHALLKKYQTQSQSLQERLAACGEQPTAHPEPEYATRNVLERLLNEALAPKTLMPDLLFHFIQRIEICQGSYENTEDGRIKKQTVRIFFRFRTETKSLGLGL